MKKSLSADAAKTLYSPHATLAALGMKMRRLKLFEQIAAHVHINQKTVKHTPVEKLCDAFIAILAGAHGLSEINTRVRPDAALQRAFGRASCAEQSVVQETLDACTLTNVLELQQSVAEIFRTHSAAYRHNYKARLQLLDIDFTPLPCGRQAERATKGYFDHQNLYGRQMGRVVAPAYDEVVVDRLYPGNVQLSTSLTQLVEATEQTLSLDPSQRSRTVIRMDSGGGSHDGVNWLLKRGYQVQCKDYSARRAAKLAKYVRGWVNDPRHPDRQLGWIAVDSVGYVKEVRRLIMKWRKKNGQVCYHTLLSTLGAEEVLALLGWPKELAANEEQMLVAYSQLYDARGGGVEIEIKESKQGIGIAKRNKKRYHAQAMVMLLGTLAHNVVVWAKRWLVAEAPKLQKYGVARMVRDVFQISGAIEFDAAEKIKRMVLNKASALARQCVKSWRVLLNGEDVSVILGQI